MIICDRLEQIAKVKHEVMGLIPFKAYPWQREFIEKSILCKRIIVNKSREIGSSTAIILLYAWLSLVYGGNLLIVSYKKDSARQLFDIAETFINNLPDELYFMRNMKTNTRNEKEFYNGSKMVALENSERVGRSYRARYLIASELAFWSNPMESWTSLNACCVKDSNICIESTPNPDMEGALFEEFLNNPEWEQVVKDYKSNPEHDEDWKKQKLADLNNNLFKFAQEYECSLERASGQSNVINLSDIKYCMELKFEPGKPHVLSLDPARFGDDRSVVTRRKGKLVLPQIVYRKRDTFVMANEMKKLIESDKPDYVNIEVNGIGAGIVDNLKHSEFRKLINEVDVSETANNADTYADVKAEIWFILGDRIKEKSIQLPNDKELERELLCKYKYDRDNRYVIQPKEEAKKALGRSPDKADSLAINFYKPKRARISII